MKTRTGLAIGLILNLTILLLTAAPPPVRAPWSPPSQLTHNLANDFQPSISSSGDGIAFVSDETGSFELYVMNADGSSVRQLTSDSNRGRELNPSISGDGTKIVFQSDVRGDEEIFVVNSDGSIPTCNPPSLVVMGTGCNLTNNRDDDVSPTISEDGTKVAFASNRDGVDVQEIYAMNVDGSSILCQGALLPACRLTLNSRINENPSMSGDGVLVAFDSNKGGDREIFTVKSDGTMPTCNSPAIPVPDTGCQLTNNFSNEDQYPSISGDGAKVVFVSAGPAIASIGKTPQSAAPGPPLQTTSTTILIVSSDGTGLKALTSTSADNRDAFISGNGRLVAFVSDSDGDKEVITVNSNGTMTTQVTVNTAIDFSPRLNYAGDILVFVSDLDGDFEIYLATLPTQCTLEGDVNNDGVVNINDLAAVGAAFGTMLGDPRYDPDADLNKDGAVNIEDLATVGANFGRAC